MLRATLPALALLLLVARPLAAQDAPPAEDDGHVAEAHGLRAVHAWTSATAGPETLVFVEIENRGAVTVTLAGASSPRAADADLVAFQLLNGVETYTHLPAMPIEAGGSLTLAPRALAIRLDGLGEPLAEGESLPVTIATSAGAFTLMVAVEAAGAGAHSHAGHAHE